MKSATAARNAAWVGSTTIVRYVISFVFSALLARTLGSESYGTYALAISLVSVVLVLAGSGFRMITVRDVARDFENAQRYVVTTLGLQSVVLLACLLLLIAGGLTLGYTRELIGFAALLGIAQGISNAIALPMSVFIAREWMGVWSIFQTVQKVVLSAVVLGAVYLTGDLYALAYPSIGVNALFLVVAVALFHRYVSPVEGRAIRLDTQLIRYLVRETAPLLISGVAYVLYRRVDKILLSQFTSNTAVIGWYGLAFNLYFTALTASDAYTRVLFPSMSRFPLNTDHALNLLGVSMRHMLVLGVGFVVSVVVLADVFLPLLFGEGFSNSINCLRILSLGFVVNAVSTVFGNRLVSTGKQSWVAKAVFAALLANVISNLILMPNYLHVGAAISVVVGESVYLLIVFSATERKEEVLHQLAEYGLKASVAGGVMALVLWIMHPLSLLASVPLGLIAYLLAAKLTGAITKDDLRKATTVFLTR